MILGHSALVIACRCHALMLDGDDVITMSNPAAESFLNLSSKSLVGEKLWEKVMIDAPLEAPFRRARENRTSLFVNDVDVGSGERAPMLCNLQFAPLQGSDDAMIVMISPREIASRINQNHSSGKAAKSAIGMAEMLAHEIKNPLAGITGAAQLLSMGLSAEDQEMTDLIVEESRRIVKLLEQVEQFGNLRPPVLKPVNIHDVLDRARQSAAVGFGAHMLFVEDYDPSLPQTLADGDQLLAGVSEPAEERLRGRARKAGTIRCIHSTTLRCASVGPMAPMRGCLCRSKSSTTAPACRPRLRTIFSSPLCRARKTAPGWGWRWCQS